MTRPRRIPVLLVRDGRLVKSIRFRDHRYIGDPLNAARIYNDLGVDELILLDIDASREGRCISTELVTAIADEMTAPLSVGGGISTLDDISQIIACGVEKVVIGTAAVKSPEFVDEAARRFGTSTISVCIDVSRSNGQPEVRCFNGKQGTRLNPIEFAREMENCGAGEIILQSIDRDGTFEGYDTELTMSVSEAVSIPVVALGGAAAHADLANIVTKAHASAAAAGSTFIYRDPQRGVLINYPSRNTAHAG